MKGGGLKAIMYSLKSSGKVGYANMFETIASKNTCKSCALGMGGQKGGMTDEMGNKLEVCKKSFQAQSSDLQAAIKPKLFEEFSIADLKNTGSRKIQALGRLNTPLVKAAGDSHYMEVSWTEALKKVTDKFKTTSPERSFFYASGRSSNEAAFLFQLFARIYGTNNISNSAYYCHQASGVGLKSVIGSGTATVVLEDLDEVDLFFVIGANPASNHPRLIKQLLNCRKRGGNVVVVNPAKESGLVRFAVPSSLKSMVSGGSSIASEYIQLQIGGDIAFLKGIAKAVIESDRHNAEFIEKHTNGSQEYFKDIDSISWDEIVSNSGVSKHQIMQIAEIYAKAKNVVFSWTLGITHHLHAVENVESIANLAMLRGMIGRRHAGLLPLRGHSNVQGVGSVGVTHVINKDTVKRIEDAMGVKLPTTPGLDTMTSIKASFNDEMDMVFILGGNLFSANPDTNFTKKALNKIPFKVFLNTTLNEGHFNAVDGEVVILPVRARDEELQRTTQESMFNFVRMSNGGSTKLNNIRSEVEIIAYIANEVAGSKLDFIELKQHGKLRELIGKTIVGYEKLTYIDKTGEEFQISNRTFHHPQFATHNGRANFRVCNIPNLKSDNGKFKMMTVRSEGQFNSVIYEEEDIYREQTSRRIVLMNKQDIESKGFKQDDLVNISSSVGKMESVCVREFDIPPGNVMTYYPESNILVSTDTDPRCKTPSFKLTWVSIEKTKLA